MSLDIFDDNIYVNNSNNCKLLGIFINMYYNLCLIVEDIVFMIRVESRT